MLSSVGVRLLLASRRVGARAELIIRARQELTGAACRLATALCGFSSTVVLLLWSLLVGRTTLLRSERAERPHLTRRGATRSGSTQFLQLGGYGHSQAPGGRRGGARPNLHGEPATIRTDHAGRSLDPASGASPRGWNRDRRGRKSPEFVCVLAGRRVEKYASGTVRILDLLTCVFSMT